MWQLGFWQSHTSAPGRGGAFKVWCYCVCVDIHVMSACKEKWRKERRKNKVPEFRVWSSGDFLPAGIWRGSWHQYFLITPEAQTLAEKSWNFFWIYIKARWETLQARYSNVGDKTHAGCRKDSANGADSSQGLYLFLSHPSLCLTVKVCQADPLQTDGGRGGRVIAYSEPPVRSGVFWCSADHVHDENRPWVTGWAELLWGARFSQRARNSDTSDGLGCETIGLYMDRKHKQNLIWQEAKHHLQVWSNKAHWTHFS